MFVKKITNFILLTLLTFLLIGQNQASQNLTLPATEIADNGLNNIGSAELQSISAELHNEEVHVKWEMNHTNAMMGFELYKSTDGSSWEMIAFLDCKETLETSFLYIDETPNWGFNFYRIKSVNIDGVSVLLRTTKIVLEYETGAKVGDFFPNPATNGMSQLNINIPNGGQANIYIHDSMGKMVRAYVKEIDAGTDTISLDLGGLSKGVFFATININRESYSKKIMVN